MLTSRPPWVGPDKNPKDLDKNMFAFLHDFNPNEPNMPKSALLFHNRWGILKKKHNVTTDPSWELGLTTQRRREGHRALTVMACFKGAKLRENLSVGFPTRSDTNWAVQPQ